MQFRLPTLSSFDIIHCVNQTSKQKENHNEVSSIEQLFDFSQVRDEDVKACLLKDIQTIHRGPHKLS
jgi:hypothetical protein